jgi:hypothetical protein
MAARSVSDAEILSVIDSEVNRLLALGIPPGMDRSDLASAAGVALATVLRKDGSLALGRLAVRHAMMDEIRKRRLRLRYDGPLPKIDKDYMSHDESVTGVPVDALPLREREAVFLHYYCGYDYREVAARMASNADAVRFWLSSARKKLSGLLHFTPRPNAITSEAKE